MKLRKNQFKKLSRWKKIAIRKIRIKIVWEKKIKKDEVVKTNQF
jgi:hypothetical protein